MDEATTSGVASVVMPAAGPVPVRVARIAILKPTEWDTHSKWLRRADRVVREKTGALLRLLPAQSKTKDGLAAVLKKQLARVLQEHGCQPCSLADLRRDARQARRSTKHLRVSSLKALMANREEHMELALRGVREWLMAASNDCGGLTTRSTTGVNSDSDGSAAAANAGAADGVEDVLDSTATAGGTAGGAELVSRSGTVSDGGAQDEWGNSDRFASFGSVLVDVSRLPAQRRVWEAMG
jgi:hypothetical protein